MKRTIFAVLAVATMSCVANAAPPIDAEASKLLAELSDHLKAQERLSLTATVKIERTASGHTQSDERAYRFTMQRPNKLRMEPLGDSATRGGTIVADGETVTAYAPPAGQYSESKQETSLDELIDGQTMAVLSGGISQTMGALLMSDPLAGLTDGVERTEYKAKMETEAGVYHVIRIQRRGGAIDWMLHENFAGDAAVPLMVRPDLSAIVARAKAAGQTLKLSMEMTLTELNTDPEIDDVTFAFDAPDEAKKVASLFEGPKLASGSPQALVGKPAPAFTLKSLDGQDVSTEDLKGKIVILDFFATWCGPCRKAMPILSEVAKEYADKDVVLYAVDLKEPKAKVSGFLKQMGWDINVLLDEDGAVAGAYAVRGIPQTVIIGKEGNVESVHVGMQPKRVITEELDELIKGKAVQG